MTLPATQQQKADLANRIYAFEERAGIIMDSMPTGHVDAEIAESQAASQLGYRPRAWGGSVVRLIDAGAWRPE